MKNFIEETIREAGKETLLFFSQSIDAKMESRSSDLVTDADFASEKIIMQAIKKSFPSHDIISEESSDHFMTNGWTWIVDPLDGTRNFHRHAPFWGILIGLLHNGEVQCGAMYFPALDVLYFAEKGKGVFKNGVKIGSNKLIKFEDSMGCLSLDPRKILEIKLLNNVAKYMPESSIWITTINCGSLAAAMVIDGSRDWCVASFAGKIWDYVVPVFMLQEANILVMTLKGESWKITDQNYIAASTNMHSDLLKLISR